MRINNCICEEHPVFSQDFPSSPNFSHCDPDTPLLTMLAEGQAPAWWKQGPERGEGRGPGEEPLRLA